jgi:hypothetical protein
MKMIRIVIGTFAGTVLAVIVLYAGFSYWQWRTYRQVFASPPAAPVSFQTKMLWQSMWREHITHRWYPASEIFAHHCTMSGSPLDATITCPTPLTGGIPDQE